MSELDDLKKEAVERIYLIPDRDEGRLRYVWCDDPSPEYGMRDDDAVEYVRRDKYDALAAHVERLRKRIAASKAQAARLMAERDALAAHVERLREALNPRLAKQQEIPMTEHDAIAITRNPWGKPESMVVEARLTVCERLEAWRDAYENLHQYAKDMGLDTTCRVGPCAEGGVVPGVVPGAGKGVVLDALVRQLEAWPTHVADCPTVAGCRWVPLFDDIHDESPVLFGPRNLFAIHREDWDHRCYALKGSRE